MEGGPEPTEKKDPEVGRGDGDVLSSRGTVKAAAHEKLVTNQHGVSRERAHRRHGQQCAAALAGNRPTREHKPVGPGMASSHAATWAPSLRKAA